MKNKIVIGLICSTFATIANAEFNVEDISTYKELKAETIDNKELNKMFKNYHKDYIKRLSKINKEMDDYKKDIVKQIEKDLKNADKALFDNQKTFDKNCKETNSEDSHKQCEDIKESIFTIGEQKKSIDIELKNFTKKIEVDRGNRIKSLYTNYINIIGQHKVDYKNEMNKK